MDSNSLCLPTYHSVCMSISGLWSATLWSDSYTGLLQALPHEVKFLTRKGLTFILKQKINRVNPHHLTVRPLTEQEQSGALEASQSDVAAASCKLGRLETT